jgi:hypothetical protein
MATRKKTIENPAPPPPSVPTKKAAAGDPLPLPTNFSPDGVYHVFVKEAFQIAKFTVKPGEAFLRGEIAETNRLKLSGLVEATVGE